MLKINCSNLNCESSESGDMFSDVVRKENKLVRYDFCKTCYKKYLEGQILDKDIFINKKENIKTTNEKITREKEGSIRKDENIFGLVKFNKEKVETHKEQYQSLLVKKTIEQLKTLLTPERIKMLEYGETVILEVENNINLNIDYHKTYNEIYKELSKYNYKYKFLPRKRSDKYLKIIIEGDMS